MLNGDQVAYEYNGIDKNYYTYDSDGSLVSMNLNGVEYYYIRNLQGDIIGLFDKNGTQVVSYTYDTWGKHDGKAELKDENGTIIQQGDIKGTLASTVGVKNPYRYRGYRFDTETGLYYLNSRYYNPEMCRFINMDSIGGKVGDLLSHNAFAYCQNNPVMNSDTSGQWFETFLDVISVVSSFVNLMRDRSWKAATVLAYDCAAAVAPVVPASGTVKAAAKVSDALKISKKGSVAKSVASKGVGVTNSTSPIKPQDHHIIPAFRGKSKPYADFIKQRNINVDDFTITVSGGRGGQHMNFIHGKGGWNQKWINFIDNNSNATAKDIYQFAGKMMDEYNLSGYPIHPYGK